jgi:phosphatidylinositol alpha-1,6-mannosyltransferase
MPCRTRNRGLDVEGLGIVYLEASACGLPVIAGNSGGAPDAVSVGETGFVTDSGVEVSQHLGRLLKDRDQARAMGEQGARWVRQNWTWQARAEDLRALLSTR